VALSGRLLSEFSDLRMYRYQLTELR
jgi:hypothetical protein